jgi:trypsin
LLKGKVNARASLAAVGIGFWLTMAGGVSAGPGGGERIVGGGVADPADWPFIAELVTKRDGHYCGGAVVSADAVVTAAHCVTGSKPNDFRIVTGRPDRNDESAGQRLRIARISIHKEYRRRGHHDIAVLTLGQATVAPAVLLPTVEEDETETAPDSEFRVAGWGGTERDGGSSSNVLLDVPLFALSDEDCSTYFSFFRPTEEVCAFGEQTGADQYDDSCFGDSGGPLIADSPRGALLVGIVSYGGRLCGVKKPGVYTQVASNLDFIARKAGLP